MYDLSSYANTFFTNNKNELQRNKLYLQPSKNLTSAKNFVICFWLIFEHYYQKVISAVSPPSFEIFLICLFCKLVALNLG